MKTATTWLNVVALAALFVAHLAFAHDLHGIRRAMRAISGTSVSQSVVILNDADLPEMPGSA